MQRTCGFGHVFDADIYPSCPYCNSRSRAIVFGGEKEIPPTGIPSNYQSGADASPTQNSYGGTVAPSGFGKPMAGENAPIGPTQMPESMRRRMEQDRNNRTVGQFKQKLGIEPVVGWLVCIEGPEMGKDYHLYGRINTIGRADSNDVVLAQDQTVSQKNHARVAYDLKHNQFQVIPGEGSNVFYLNDEPVYIPHPLQAYDILEFGQTKLIFIPLCSDRFQWPQKKAGGTP